MAIAAALVCLTPWLAACSFSWDDSDPLVVETENGKIKGRQDRRHPRVARDPVRRPARG